MSGGLKIKHLRWAMTAAIAALIGFHLLGQFAAHVLGRGRLMGFVGMFRVQSEHNAPTYFNGLLLCVAAALLLMITVHIGRQSLRQALPWLGLGLMFGYLACDEVFSIHERFNYLGESSAVFDGLNYKWAVTGVVLVIAVVALFFRFWLHLPGPTRLRFAVAAAVFVGGAIGFETLSGQYASAYGEGFGYAMLTAWEEGMEMAGVAIFILALAHYIQPRFAPLGVHLIAEPPRQRTESDTGTALPPVQAIDPELRSRKRVA